MNKGREREGERGRGGEGEGERERERETHPPRCYLAILFPRSNLNLQINCVKEGKLPRETTTNLSHM